MITLQPSVHACDISMVTKLRMYVQIWNVLLDPLLKLLYHFSILFLVSLLFSSYVLNFSPLIHYGVGCSEASVITHFPRSVTSTTESNDLKGYFLALRRLLLVSYCVVVWVLFLVLRRLLLVSYCVGCEYCSVSFES